MDRPELSSFLRIYEGEDICEAVMLGVSNADFRLRGKNVITGQVQNNSFDAIRAIDFIDLEVSRLECDESWEMYDLAWALIYLQRFDRRRYPKSAKKPFNRAWLQGFTIHQGQIVYAETYQILMLHLETIFQLLTQHQSMQTTIVDLLKNPRSPLLREDMNRKQVVASTALMLDSALRAPRR